MNSCSVCEGRGWYFIHREGNYEATSLCQCKPSIDEIIFTSQLLHMYAADVHALSQEFGMGACEKKPHPTIIDFVTEIRRQKANRKFTPPKDLACTLMDPLYQGRWAQRTTQ